MFVVLLKYITETEMIDNYLPAHRDYLTEQYQNGNFIISGRQIPRTGGIIFANVCSRDELEGIIEKDPFKINNIADYEFIEFEPTMSCEELEWIL
ncbi:YciI family protein [Methanoplanus limicola]|uniref:YCII-related protein n=1 Tax=Methanoplanus limicola DSM 2279 TaxID=937775 RepID=H1Z358_9EURY|nr:YciI family protein [Methanoplanus limicola]EHQ35598.1 YCII-related protein [Methanoplanus limicola DSM 2279]